MTYNGYTYDAEKLGNLKYTKSLSGKGFDGICTSSFSCDIHTEVEYYEVADTGQVITFNCQFQMPEFIVAERRVNGKVMTIVAYDRCKNLDIPFDYSAYSQFDDKGKAKWYLTSLVCMDIASQCGLNGGGYAGDAITRLCYNDFAGKTCRQILEDISKAECGYWYCSDDNELAFKPFTPAGRNEYELDLENSSKIKINGYKTIRGIVAEDELYGTVYSSGKDWKNSEKLSGRYLSTDVAQKVENKILSGGKEYIHYGWSCGQMITRYMYNLLDVILRPDGYGGMYKLPILSLTYTFGLQAVIAALSAETPDISFSEYSDLYSRQIAGTLKLDRSYGCVKLQRDGMKFVFKNENSDIEEYGFEIAEKGVTSYDGAVIDKTMPDSIVKLSDTCRRITYGGTTYQLDYEIDSEGNKTNIKFERLSADNDEESNE